MPENRIGGGAPTPPRLLDRVRDAVLVRHYSPRTAEAYVYACPSSSHERKIARILQHLEGLPLLATALMYGSGLRLLECLRLRVKDIDFDRGEILVVEGKGRKDRRTLLPDQIASRLRAHLATLKAQHQQDQKAGLGRVFLPERVERSQPEAAADWAWQWVLPATRCHAHSSGARKRHHFHETGVQRAFARAVLRAGIHNYDLHSPPEPRRTTCLKPLRRHRGTPANLRLAAFFRIGRESIPAKPGALVVRNTGVP